MNPPSIGNLKIVGLVAALRALRDRAPTPENAGLLGNLADEVEALETQLTECRANVQTERTRATNAEGRATDLSDLVEDAKPLVESVASAADKDDAISGMASAATDWIKRWLELRS